MRLQWRRAEWQRYRLKCFELAKGRCAHCDRPLRIFHVHHPDYLPERMPWEYPIEFCQVLCPKHHGMVHGEVPPDFGWTLLHSDWDVEESSGSTFCDLCNTPMEWHNELWHPQWGEITVGYSCAEKLGNPDVHQARKISASRRSFLVSPRWRPTPKGWRYKHGAKDVLVYEAGPGYKLKIGGKWGKLEFGTLDAAKMHAAKVVIR